MRLKDSKPVKPEEVYTYLTVDKKLSKNHALGIMANIQAESGFNSSAIGDGGTSFGLFQHHADRAKNLKSYAGGDWTDYRKQIDFALQEKVTKNYLSSDFVSPEKASEWWTINWERPSDAKTKAKQRTQNLKNFAEFSEYVPQNSEQTASTKRFSNQPVPFEVVGADGQSILTYVNPADLEKEVQRAKQKEEKTEEKKESSPEMKVLEQKQQERLAFLSAATFQNNIPQYFTGQEEEDRGILISEIEIPELQTALPTLPNIFSFGTT